MNQLSSTPDIDMTLEIRKLWSAGREHLEFLVRSPYFPGPSRFKTFGGPRVQGLETFRIRLLGRLEELHQGRDVQGGKLSSKQAYDELRNLCHGLYDQLFPSELYELMRELRINSLLIVSEEAWIPWELLLPASDDTFFGLRFAMSRWPNLTPPKRNRIESLLGISGGDELAHMESELKWLDGWRQDCSGLEGDVLSDATTEAFRDALKDRSFHLLHFVGHGEAAEGKRREAWLKLADRPLRPSLLPIQAIDKMREESPLVFFNACQVGQLQTSLTGDDGFAPQLIHTFGCSAFLAPIWSIDDKRAFDFARTFYNALHQGQTIAGAVRTARELLWREEPHEMTWLAYCLFAHPGARLAFGDAELKSPPESPQQPRRIRPEPGDEIEAEEGSVLVYVPGGEYRLGTDERLTAYDDTKTYDWAQPAHRVRLRPFWIGRDPVTNRQYQRFLDAEPAAQRPAAMDHPKLSAPDQPVVGIGWEEARAYCEWAGMSLPSEAQWEAAARGQDGRPFPWGLESPRPDLAHYAGRDGPAPVGTLKAGRGPFGTLDQAGNVWEWCADTFRADAYKRRDGARDPVEARINRQGWRIVRGGAWTDELSFLKAAFRQRFPASARTGYIGFRVCFVVPDRE